MAALGTGAAIVLQTLYFGFSPTLPGAIAGAVWGFANGLIFGILVAWLYNRFLLTRQHHVSPPHPAPDEGASPGQ